MNLFTIIFVGLVATVGVAMLWILYESFRKFPEAEEYLERQKESLMDEHLFDPKIGMISTVEQVEIGEQQINFNRIVPEEEFKYYRDEFEEVPLMHNYLIGIGYNNIPNPEYYSAPLEHLITLYRKYFWTSFRVYQNSPKSLLHFLKVDDNQGRWVYRELHLLVIIEINEKVGHHFVRRKHMVDNITKKLNPPLIQMEGLEVISHDTPQNLELSKKILQEFNTKIIEEAEDVVDQIDFTPLNIELIENYIVLKTENQVRLNDLMYVLKIVDRLEKQFS